jgi:hypothetical protein
VTLTIDELDGIYEVHTDIAVETSGDPYRVKGDGRTHIRNGQTFRKDGNGFIWESTFTLVGENEVEMRATLDPSHAQGGGRFVKDEKGNPTKGIVSYSCLLKATRENGKLVLSGNITHAGETTRLMLVKAGPDSQPKA